MTSGGTTAVVSNRLVRLFVAAAEEEVGREYLVEVLVKADLAPSLVRREAMDRLDGPRAAQAYASLQQALRLFYGRGARGALLRIGRRMWERWVAQANFLEKAELEIARRLPVPARRRRALDLVAERLREGGGSASVHPLDLDLLLADHSSASTCAQTSEAPICFVTLGIIQGALAWATRQEADVEEIACKATGAPICQFKLKQGGS